MFPRIAPLAPVFVIALASVGCGNFSNFTTARALNAHEGRFEGIAGVAGASLAMDVRARVGLGQGFEAGVSMGWSGLLNGDVKFQFLRQEDDPKPGRSSGVGGTGPFNAAFGVGAGSGLFSDHAYVQAMMSRRFNTVEAYFAYRYEAIRLDIDFDDPDDVEDTEDTSIEDLVEDADGRNVNIHHFFFGLEVEIGRGVYLTPEFSLVAGDASGMGNAGIGIGFRW